LGHISHKTFASKLSRKRRFEANEGETAIRTDLIGEPLGKNLSFKLMRIDELTLAPHTNGGVAGAKRAMSGAGDAMFAAVTPDAGVNAAFTRRKVPKDRMLKARESHRQAIVEMTLDWTRSFARHDGTAQRVAAGR
jgi:hypothetical protein